MKTAIRYTEAPHYPETEEKKQTGIQVICSSLNEEIEFKKQDTKEISGNHRF